MSQIGLFEPRVQFWPFAHSKAKPLMVQPVKTVIMFEAVDKADTRKT